VHARPSVLQCATRASVVRSSLVVAVVVGSILNLINQGDALFGEKPIVLWKLGLTYVVPYLVSTYGAVTALRSRG
jgi:hypothetical protein